MSEIRVFVNYSCSSYWIGRWLKTKRSFLLSFQFDMRREQLWFLATSRSNENNINLGKGLFGVKVIKNFFYRPGVAFYLIHSMHLFKLALFSFLNSLSVYNFGKFVKGAFTNYVNT